MRTGTVVFIANAGQIQDTFEESGALRELGLDPKDSLFAARTDGFYDLNDATRLLIQRGAKRIEAIRTAVQANGRLIAFGESIHMFG